MCCAPSEARGCLSAVARGWGERSRGPLSTPRASAFPVGRPTTRSCVPDRTGPDQGGNDLPQAAQGHKDMVAPPGLCPWNPQLDAFLGMVGRVFEDSSTRDPPTMVRSSLVVSGFAVPSRPPPYLSPILLSPSDVTSPSTRPVPAQTHHSPMPVVGKTHRSPGAGGTGKLGSGEPPQQGWRPRLPEHSGGHARGPGLYPRSGRGPPTVWLVLGQRARPFAAAPSCGASALSWGPGGDLGGPEGCTEAPGTEEGGVWGRPPAFGRVLRQEWHRAGCLGCAGGHLGPCGHPYPGTDTQTPSLRHSEAWLPWWTVSGASQPTRALTRHCLALDRGPQWGAHGPHERGAAAAGAGPAEQPSGHREARPGWL